MADALRELRSIAAAGSYSDGDNPLRRMVGALQEAADAYRAAAADPGIEGHTGDAISISAAARAHRYDSVQQVVEQLRGYLAEADSIRADAAAAVYAAPYSYINFPGDALNRVERAFDNLAMKVEAAAAELAAITTSAQSSARPGTGPMTLGGYTAIQLTHLSDRKLRDLSLRWSMDPETAAAWWASLPAATAALLARKAPWLVGALDGIPAGARVQANKVIAADQADHIQRQLRGDGLSEEQRGALEKEASYLKDVAAGDRQLYLYDPANSRIIEMIGTPGPDTDEIITYSPGTFASTHLLYSGDAQSVADYLTQDRPGSVAFVVKDGPYPGEDTATGEANMIRIGEANSPDSYQVTGDRLVSLQNGLAQDIDLAGASTAGIGHSWGLTNITGSETLGAHYDHVVSLSGAWTPEDWHADPDSTYKDYSYVDTLQIGQSTGLVGEGNTPRADGSGFDHDPYYVGPNPVTIQTPDGPFPDFGALNDNHNLVASDKTANEELLFQVRKDLG